MGAGNAMTRTELERRLDAIADRFAGTLVVYARNLATGEQVARSADEPWGTASAIKLAILCTAFARAQAGALRLDERVEVTAADLIGGTGVLKELDPGLRPTVRDLCVLMIVQSDNSATNLVLDRVGGAEAVTASMREIGLPSVVLHNRVDFEAIGTDVRNFGEASATGLATLVARLYAGEVVDAAGSAAMLEILGRQQQLDCVPRYLAYNPHADALGLEQDVTYAGKTGVWPGIRTDACLISLRDGGDLACCVMAQGSEDLTIAAESEPAVLCGLVGRLLVEYWWRGEGDPPVLPTPAERSA